MVNIYGPSIFPNFCAKKYWGQRKRTCYLLRKILAYLSRPAGCSAIFAARPYLTTLTHPKILCHKLPNPDQFPTW